MRDVTVDCDRRLTCRLRLTTDDYDRRLELAQDLDNLPELDRLAVARCGPVPPLPRIVQHERIVLRTDRSPHDDRFDPASFVDDDLEEPD